MTWSDKPIVDTGGGTFALYCYDCGGYIDTKWGAATIQTHTSLRQCIETLRDRIIRLEQASAPAS